VGLEVLTGNKLRCTDAREPARIQPAATARPALRFRRPQPLHIRHAKPEHDDPDLQGTRRSVRLVLACLASVRFRDVELRD
jgi:hypothetical protein